LDEKADLVQFVMNEIYFEESSALVYCTKLSIGQIINENIKRLALGV
jgi:hypothetical protein